LHIFLKGVFTTSIGLLFVAFGLQSSRGQSNDPPKPLVPYTSCHFPDELEIVKTDPLAPGVTERTVETADGSRQIDMDAGIRVMFAYPFTDFYANVKVELLPAKTYPQLKKDLLANFAYTQAHSPGSAINLTLPADLHKFEVHGDDRGKLEGGVLGLYLLFDDATHVVTTIYFLNQEGLQRKFQTIEEYRRLRDQFLTSFTGCIRENQALAR
jgi:hypothetical protein